MITQLCLLIFQAVPPQAVALTPEGVPWAYAASVAGGLVSAIGIQWKYFSGKIDQKDAALLQLAKDKDAALDKANEGRLEDLRSISVLLTSTTAEVTKFGTNHGVLNSALEKGLSDIGREHSEIIKTISKLTPRG